MSTVLLPQIHTPTEAARLRFLNAIYDRGWSWLGMRRTQALECASGVDGVCRLYYLVSTNCAQIHWNPTPMKDRTMVNSVAHFLSYVDRHSIPLAVNELRARP